MGGGAVDVVDGGPPRCRNFVLAPKESAYSAMYDGAGPGPGAFTPGWCWSLGHAVFGRGLAVSIPADRLAPPLGLTYRWGP